MSEVAGESILEQITNNVYETISTVKAGAIYKHDLNVDRLDRIDSMKHLDVLIIQEDAAEMTRDCFNITIRQPYEVLVKIVKAEGDTDPKERVANRINADIVKAILRDITRGGFAWNTTLQPPTFDPDGIVVRFDVEYDTLWNDPYTKAVRAGDPA